MAGRAGRVHVVTNRRIGASGGEYVTHLLRRTYREGGKVRNETVGNLSHLPEELVAVVRRWLAGERFLVSVDAFEVERSLPHGHVAGVLELGSKLACTRALSQSMLAEELGVGGVDADALYDAMDWLLERQEAIEAGLARRHLAEGTLVL
jgi:hypothetical protein